jgi:hypothetical protein
MEHTATAAHLVIHSLNDIVTTKDRPDTFASSLCQ